MTSDEEMDEIERLQAQLDEAREHVGMSGEWRDAITNRAIIDGIDTNLPPREMLEAILATARRDALDPLVSEEAAKNAARIAGLEAQLAAAGRDRRLILKPGVVIPEGPDNFRMEFDEGKV